MTEEKQVSENRDDERWLSDGNCTYCRRKGRCEDPCPAQRRRKAAILRAIKGAAVAGGPYGKEDGGEQI